jgi:hypothetical protein
MNSNIHISRPILGVDIGRVIIHGDGPDTSFIGGSDEDAMRAPAMDGAFEALARLTRCFGGRVHVVSKCGQKVEARSRAWLARHRFFDVTGIRPEDLHFCKKRPDKAPICAKLGIGFFVDDRIDILRSMEGIVPHRFLFGASEAEAGITPAPTWAVCEQAILAALDADVAVSRPRGTPVALAR